MAHKGYGQFLPPDSCILRWHQAAGMHVSVFCCYNMRIVGAVLYPQLHECIEDDVPASSIPVPAGSRQVQSRPLGSQTPPLGKTVERQYPHIHHF